MGDSPIIRLEQNLMAILRSNLPAETIDRLMESNRQDKPEPMEFLARVSDQAARVAQGAREEIRQLRGDTGISAKDLQAASDECMETITQTCAGMLAIANEAGVITAEQRAGLKDRMDTWRAAWGKFLALNNRAAFQAAVNSVKAIRVRAIYTAVALDRWRNLPEVEVASNAAGNDLAIIIQALCEIGGQDDISYAYNYVADHGEDWPPAGEIGG